MTPDEAINVLSQQIEAIDTLSRKMKEYQDTISVLTAENKKLRAGKADEPEPCYSVSKVAELLSVSEQTVRRMIENNKIRAVAVSGADGRNCRKVIPKSAYINYLRGEGSEKVRSI